MIDEKKLIESFRAIENTGRESFPVDAIVEAIECQPEVNNWIPCSERLPENKKWKSYLCTLDGELCGQEEPFTGMCGFENGEWDERDCVIAWQPLPEPYREEEHE